MYKKTNITFGNKNLQRRGFTLIEVMTSLSIFAVIMTISMGSILGVFEANRKSESLKTVMDNLNFSLETMSREMRFGKNYHCTSSGTLTAPLSCPSGSNFISFLSSDNKQIVYRLNQTAIQKSTNGGATFIDITAPEVTITGLGFYVLGAAPSPTDQLQPKVILQVKGYAGPKPSSRTSFTLETQVSQRLRDF